MKNIKRCRKKAEENWIGEQYSEIEENLRKENSKRAYQLVRDKRLLSKIVQKRCLTEERQILNRRTEYCSELYNYNPANTVYWPHMGPMRFCWFLRGPVYACLVPDGYLQG